VNADFPDDKKATNVIIKIPMPPTATHARCETVDYDYYCVLLCLYFNRINVPRGRARYEPGERALVWRISSFPGESEASLIAVVDLITATREKPWIRPPITMEFLIPMHSSSGVQVRFLKVYDRSNYQTQRWVRYLSKAGEYQVRI
jgi:AP-2 complex subunit mu-1